MRLSLNCSSQSLIYWRAIRRPNHFLFRSHYTSSSFFCCCLTIVLIHLWNKSEQWINTQIPSISCLFLCLAWQLAETLFKWWLNPSPDCILPSKFTRIVCCLRKWTKIEWKQSCFSFSFSSSRRRDGNRPYLESRLHVEGKILLEKCRDCDSGQILRIYKDISTPLRKKQAKVVKG